MQALAQQGRHASSRALCPALSSSDVGVAARRSRRSGRRLVGRRQRRRALRCWRRGKLSRQVCRPPLVPAGPYLLSRPVRTTTQHVLRRRPSCAPGCWWIRMEVRRREPRWHAPLPLQNCDRVWGWGVQYPAAVEYENAVCSAETGCEDADCRTERGDAAARGGRAAGDSPAETRASCLRHYVYNWRGLYKWCPRQVTNHARHSLSRSARDCLASSVRDSVPSGVSRSLCRVQGAPQDRLLRAVQGQ